MPASKIATTRSFSRRARERTVELAQLKALAKEQKMALYWVIVMVFLYFDNMTTYFSKTFTGAIFPYAAIVLAMFIYGVAFVGYPKLKLPRYGYVAGYLLVMSFSVAILSLDEFHLNRFRDLISAVVAFGVGYACISAAKGTGQIRLALLFIGGSHALVCFVAVTNLYPSVFPVVDAVALREGKEVLRPEVMTDQNFQIFYFAPVALLMALENSTVRLITLLVILAVSAFVLSELQTRSGTLVLGVTSVLAAAVGMYSRGKLDFRLIAFVLLGLLGALAFLDKIIMLFQSIILRFTVDDFDTGEGRLEMFLFTFKHLADVKWWVPQGNRAYIDATGVLATPHSNITAIFVESGILGLIGWVLAVVVPLIVLGFRWWKKKTDPIGDIVLCGGVSTLATQLSLNVALLEFVWFWSGAVLAAIVRCEMTRSTQSAVGHAAFNGFREEEKALSPLRGDTPSREIAPQEPRPVKTLGPRQHAASLRRIDLSTRLERPASSLVKRPVSSIKRALGSSKRRPTEK